MRWRPVLLSGTAGVCASSILGHVSSSTLGTCYTLISITALAPAYFAVSMIRERHHGVSTSCHVLQRQHTLMTALLSHGDSH